MSLFALHVGNLSFNALAQHPQANPTRLTTLAYPFTPIVTTMANGDVRTGPEASYDLTNFAPGQQAIPFLQYQLANTAILRTAPTTSTPAVANGVLKSLLEPHLKPECNIANLQPNPLHTPFIHTNIAQDEPNVSAEVLYALFLTNLHKAWNEDKLQQQNQQQNQQQQPPQQIDYLTYSAERDPTRSMASLVTTCPSNWGVEQRVALYRSHLLAQLPLTDIISENLALLATYIDGELKNQVAGACRLHKNHFVVVSDLGFAAATFTLWELNPTTCTATIHNTVVDPKLGVANLIDAIIKHIHAKLVNSNGMTHPQLPHDLFSPTTSSTLPGVTSPHEQVYLQWFRAVQTGLEQHISGQQQQQSGQIPQTPTSPKDASPGFSFTLPPYPNAHPDQHFVYDMSMAEYKEISKPFATDLTKAPGQVLNASIFPHIAATIKPYTGLDGDTIVKGRMTKYDEYYTNEVKKVVFFENVGFGAKLPAFLRLELAQYKRNFFGQAHTLARFTTGHALDWPGAVVHGACLLADCGVFSNLTQAPQTTPNAPQSPQIPEYRYQNWKITYGTTPTLSNLSAIAPTIGVVKHFHEYCLTTQNASSQQDYVASFGQNVTKYLQMHNLSVYTRAVGEKLSKIQQLSTRFDSTILLAPQNGTISLLFGGIQTVVAAIYAALYAPGAKAEPNVQIYANLCYLYEELQQLAFQSGIFAPDAVQYDPLAQREQNNTNVTIYNRELLLQQLTLGGQKQQHVVPVVDVSLVKLQEGLRSRFAALKGVEETTQVVDNKNNNDKAQQNDDDNQDYSQLPPLMDLDVLQNNNSTTTTTTTTTTTSGMMDQQSQHDEQDPFATPTAGADVVPQQQPPQLVLSPSEQQKQQQDNTADVVTTQDDTPTEQQQEKQAENNNNNSNNDNDNANPQQNDDNDDEEYENVTQSQVQLLQKDAGLFKIDPIEPSSDDEAEEKEQKQDNLQQQQQEQQSNQDSDDFEDITALTVQDAQKAAGLFKIDKIESESDDEPQQQQQQKEQQKAQQKEQQKTPLQAPTPAPIMPPTPMALVTTPPAAASQAQQPQQEQQQQQPQQQPLPAVAPQIAQDTTQLSIVQQQLRQQQDQHHHQQQELMKQLQQQQAQLLNSFAQLQQTVAQQQQALQAAHAAELQAKDDTIKQLQNALVAEKKVNEMQAAMLKKQTEDAAQKQAMFKAMMDQQQQMMMSFMQQFGNAQ